MARPRKIAWEERLAIFLDYRRLRKVSVTAKKHKVARSTVDLIVQEFTDQGFSRAPRPDLSPEILGQLQGRHLQEVLGLLKAPFSTHLAEPRANKRAGLEPADALGDGIPQKETASPTALSLSPELLWHLKGTVAQRALEEAQHAFRDYDQRCLTLWRDISSALAEASGLPVRPYKAPKDRTDSEAYITHELVDLVYDRVFDDSSSSDTDPRNWFTLPDDPALLMANNYSAAVVGEPGHEAVRQGMARLLQGAFREFQRRAGDLTRLHHDLELLVAVVQETLNGVTPEEVRQGICPACPYPESRQGSDSGQSTAKRASKGKRPQGGDHG